MKTLSAAAAPCRFLYPTLREIFPDQLADVTAEGRSGAPSTAPVPTSIRTEADELTYALHIMVRYELEKALMQGTLAVADLRRMERQVQGVPRRGCAR